MAVCMGPRPAPVVRGRRFVVPALLVTLGCVFARQRLSPAVDSTSHRGAFTEAVSFRRHGHSDADLPRGPCLFCGDSADDTIRWYQPPAREYSRRELIADRLVNFGGVAAAMLAAPLLVLVSRAGGDAIVRQAGLLVHGCCMILMFSCSALFHYWAWDGSCQRFLLMLDHIGINSMIAGCYTPVMIHCRCYRLLLFVWACAMVGYVGEIMLYVGWKQSVQLDEEVEGGVDLMFHPFRYLAMGWSVVGVWSEVMKYVSMRGKALMIAGGLSFTLGVPFHLSASVEFHHAMWHLFVFIGSAFMYSVCLLEVAGSRHAKLLDASTTHFVTG
ncbi:unnamed protein product [Symbiodinium natans]|uniref:Uncharacterized protein n=1 Tax=Symbiodinium natans TaxID=878477 RepID=A0A812T012_9DINO|nr:unnamed protein product [Symbiodinium natans]